MFHSGFLSSDYFFRVPKKTSLSAFLINYSPNSSSFWLSLLASRVGFDSNQPANEAKIYLFTFLEVLSGDGAVQSWKSCWRSCASLEIKFISSFVGSSLVANI